MVLGQGVDAGKGLSLEHSKRRAGNAARVFLDGSEPARLFKGSGSLLLLAILIFIQCTRQWETLFSSGQINLLAIVLRIAFD